MNLKVGVFLRSISIVLTLSVIHAQNQQATTRKPLNENSNDYTKKILLIPFENKMYMSEIDYYINKETKLNQKQIRYELRDGLNEQLYRAFKKRKITPIDLMSDTVKYNKDLKYIYGNISYDYVKIPDQNNYTPPSREKREKGIQNGQIVAESDNENKFMNTRVLSPALVPYLYQKYKADYYLFINELDLKASVVNPTEYIPETSKRKIIVHYTVFSVDAKEINSGIAETEADIKINIPAKIIKNYFFVISETIADRVLKQISNQIQSKKQ